MLDAIVSLAIGLACALLLVKSAPVLRDVFFSPLRRVPGPWHAPLTGLVAQINTINKRQVHHYHELHEKYGRVVRIGPREVIVSDLAAFRTIHRMGTQFRKSDLYKYFNATEAGKGPYALFTQTDPVQHAAHRKLLARGFGLHSLRSEWESIVQEKVRMAVQSMRAHAAEEESGEVDILKWWMLMAADVISKLMFGESFDMLKTGQRDPYFDAIAENEGVGAMAWSFPWLYQILKRLPIPSIRYKLTSYQRIFNIGQRAIQNSRAGSHNRNIFATVFAQAEKGEGIMTDHEIVVNAAAFMLAGTDTTATTLTYLVWAVLQQPALQTSLEAEIAAVDASFTDATLEALPLLNAVIKETLRLYGAAPGGLPRVTPAGGATLAGYYIPEGTVVSTQAWTLHRDPSVFKDPDRFDHTRWLAPDLQSLKASFSPYGAGSRQCIGIHLADMELRLAAAMFFRECPGAKLAPSTTRLSMEVENVFLVSPRGHACKVILTN